MKSRNVVILVSSVLFTCYDRLSMLSCRRLPSLSFRVTLQPCCDVQKFGQVLLVVSLKIRVRRTVRCILLGRLSLSKLLQQLCIINRPELLQILRLRSLLAKHRLL